MFDDVILIIQSKSFNFRNANKFLNLIRKFNIGKILNLQMPGEELERECLNKPYDLGE